MWSTDRARTVRGVTRQCPCRRKNWAWSVPRCQGCHRPPLDRADSLSALDLMVEDAAKTALDRHCELDRSHRPPSNLQAATYSNSLLLPRQIPESVDQTMLPCYRTFFSSELNFDSKITAKIAENNGEDADGIECRQGGRGAERVKQMAR